MVRNFRPGPDWVPGVFDEKLGPLSYMVKVGNGQVWKRHIDHLRRSAASQGSDSQEPQDVAIYSATTNEPSVMATTTEEQTEQDPQRQQEQLPES